MKRLDQSLYRPKYVDYHPRHFDKPVRVVFGFTKVTGLIKEFSNISLFRLGIQRALWNDDVS